MLVRAKLIEKLDLSLTRAFRRVKVAWKSGGTAIRDAAESHPLSLSGHNAGVARVDMKRTIPLEFRTL
jgi:hypothetical protein